MQHANALTHVGYHSRQSRLGECLSAGGYLSRNAGSYIPPDPGGNGKMPRFSTPTIGRNTLVVLAVSMPCLASCGGDKSNGQITPGAGTGGAFGAPGGATSGGTAGAPTAPNGGAPAAGMGGKATSTGGVPGGPGGGTPSGGGVPAGTGGTVGGGGAAGSGGTPNGGSAGMGGGGDGGGPSKPYVDPGTGPWTVVP